MFVAIIVKTFCILILYAAILSCIYFLYYSHGESEIKIFE